MIWSELHTVEIPEEYRKIIGGHPFVAETLYRRGVVQILDASSFLDSSLYKPSDPNDFPDMKRLVDRLERAILTGEKILVWGDFDVDGQTATSLLVSILNLLQAKVTFYIPVRSEESHGINPDKLRKLLKPDTKILLSCDTGIASFDAINLANQFGLDVLITDHHELPEQLPNAYAIINPRLLKENHPFNSLPGVGVAYELGIELLNRFGLSSKKEDFLDLVALGIVADLAILSGETRYLLQKGLGVLQETKRPGLLAILERIELDPAGITEDQIGFLIAPRLNALGRLADANLAVELLTTSDQGRARIIALQLETLNARRRLITNNVFEGALAQVRANPQLLEEPVIILANPDWPAGVIGIVASRLVERYGKPVILISSGEDGQGRGSARSIEGINISSALVSLQEILNATGGHPMAAGFSIKWERLSEFRRKLSQKIISLGKIPQMELNIDGILPLTEINLELVNDLERLSPFGPGNPPLTLVSQNVRIKYSSTLGKEEDHLMLTIVDEKTATSKKVIWWHGSGWSLPDGLFNLAYRVRTSSNRGKKEALIEWIDYQTPEKLEDSSRLRTRLPKILDYRKEPHPLLLLKMLRNQQDTQVFAEGDVVKKLTASEIISVTRLGLRPCETLVFWTSPPGPDDLAEVVRLTTPKNIIFFDEPTGIDTYEKFLARLTGLVKYALRMQQGKVELKALAALTSHRESTVLLGLIFLNDEGFIQIKSNQGNELHLTPGSVPENVEGKPQQGLSESGAFASLKSSLLETMAYRRFYHLAEITNVINPEALTHIK